MEKIEELIVLVEEARTFFADLVDEDVADEEPVSDWAQESLYACEIL